MGLQVILGVPWRKQELDDPENILNSTFDDYAQYRDPEIAALSNHMIVGVKEVKEGELSNKSLKRIGFMVEMKSRGVSLNVLKFFRIKGFKDGGEVFEKIVESSDIVSVDLIGSTKVEKLRLSVRVPENTAIDEFQLWTWETVDVNLNFNPTTFNIYYAFADDKDVAYDKIAPQDIISDKTGARLNLAETKHVGAVSVAQITDNISFLIDDDPELQTYASLTNTVAAGAGIVLAVNFGRTYEAGNQVGIVVDGHTYLAMVNGLAKWLTIETFKDGESTGDKKDEWSVLGADVLGYGDKGILMINSTEPFDEIRITKAGLADALEFDTGLYGIFVSSDLDADGIPDSRDENTCAMEFVLDEEAVSMQNKGKNYEKGRLALHRTFTRSEGTAAENSNVWNSLVLPVNLTGVQLRNAFGNYVRLAEAVGLNSNDGQSSNLVRFELIYVPAHDNDVVVEAGKFYIIRTKRLPDVATGDTYITTDPTYTKNDKKVNGEIYFINNVDYNTNLTPKWREWDGVATGASAEYGEEKTGSELNVDQQATFSTTFNTGDFKEEANNTVTYTATMAVNESVPAGIYGLNGGHLVRANAASKMKGFRFWLADDREAASTGAPRAFSFCVADTENGTTEIYHVVDDQQFMDTDAVYDMTGRKVRSAADVQNLTPGVYVVGGKKIFIK